MNWLNLWAKQKRYAILKRFWNLVRFFVKLSFRKKMTKTWPYHFICVYYWLHIFWPIVKLWARSVNNRIKNINTLNHSLGSVSLWFSENSSKYIFVLLNRFCENWVCSPILAQKLVVSLINESKEVKTKNRKKFANFAETEWEKVGYKESCKRKTYRNKESMRKRS